eukprot:jgi/Mesen1/10071/ME000730S09339
MQVVCLSRGNEGDRPASFLISLGGGSRGSATTTLLVNCPLDAASSLHHFLPTRFAAPPPLAPSLVLPPPSGPSPAAKRRRHDGGEGAPPGELRGDGDGGGGGDEPLPSQDELAQRDWLRPLIVQVHGHRLLDCEARYRVTWLPLVTPAVLDAVLITSPYALLALPYLRAQPGFTARVFATDAALQVGRFLMKEMVALHDEYRQLYGYESDRQAPASRGGMPPWQLPSRRRLGFPAEFWRELDGRDSCVHATWRSMYRSDMEACLATVKALKLNEDVPLGSGVSVTPCSSGLSLGCCNWLLCDSLTRQQVLLVGASLLAPTHAAPFSQGPLQTGQVALFAEPATSPRSDRLQDGELPGPAAESGKAPHRTTGDVRQKEVPGGRHQELQGPENGSSAVQPGRSPAPGEPTAGVAIPGRWRGESQHEVAAGEASLRAGLEAVAEAAVGTLKEGGSVLLPVSPSGTLLELVEVLAEQMQAGGFGGVTIHYVSPAAHELMAYGNIVPEWLSPSRQDRLFKAEALFGHVALLQEKRVRCHPNLLSPSLWAELDSCQCVVLAGHESVRMGPCTHLLSLWRSDPASALIFTQPHVNIPLVLAPFQPLQMRVLHIPIDTCLRREDVLRLTRQLQPRHILVPQSLANALGTAGFESNTIPFSVGQTCQVALEEP